MAKRVFEVTVYRTVIQVGTVRVKASDERAAKRAVKGSFPNPPVKQWDEVTNETPFSMPETPLDVSGSQFDVEGE